MWPRTFNFEYPDAGGSSGGLEPPVPGTGEGTPAPSEGQPPPGETTETPSQDHGPVPYSRFREVNDRRRALEDQLQPLVELESMGYDAANLQRLVAWEQEYSQDPVGAWLTHAESLEGLPEPVKQAIEAAKGNPPADGGPPGSAPDSGEGENDVPAWGRMLVDDFEARKTAEEQAAHRGIVDAMLNAWRETDEKLGIVTPDEQMLMYIQASASDGGDPQEIFVRAHKAMMSFREGVLQAEVKSPAGTAPRSVPGSGGAPPTADPIRPRTLREATKAAAAAEAAGRLHI